MRNVFIIGSKGIPSAYGGYETFVDKLTEYHQCNDNIKYHIACKANESGEVYYHNARCFKIKVPDIGSAQAIYYDVKALRECCKYAKANNLSNYVIYILACRIGPFMNHYLKKIHKTNGVIYVNPDGHEWMRAKWSMPIRLYWKISERLMVKNCDLLVCDSMNIEEYIKNEYFRFNPKTTYISYGAELRKSALLDNDIQIVNWYNFNGLSPKSYYLIVGRFVPENNYEIMIKEFIKSKTQKKLVIVTNTNNEFLQYLKEKTKFEKDKRIIFVGTIYNQELLMKVRENAYAYFHGHEVGGTNPSLLEALGSTELNFLLDVGFNREVANESSLYWTKDEDNLSNLINRSDCLDENTISSFGKKAKNQIQKKYSWKFISSQYEKIFTNIHSGGIS